MNILDELKNDILNGDELQYEYEIDGVSVTVLMDYSDDEIQIIATSHNIDNTKTWEAEYDNEDELNDTLDELVEFIRFENTKNTVKAALNDKFCIKEGADFNISASDNGFETEIQYHRKRKRLVSVTVDNQDIADDKDGIITKVAEFFVNY